MAAVLDCPSQFAWAEPNGESMGSCQEEAKRHQIQNRDEPMVAIKATLASLNTSAVPQDDDLSTLMQ